MLRADSLTLRYPHAGSALPVLQNFSLQVRPMDIIALLGPSGVGKSSLLRVLAGLQHAESGEVHVEGERLRGPHPALGFVFQDPSLLPWLNLRDNVGFGMDFKHQPNLDAQTRQSRIDQALREVGLTDAQTRYPGELSGGMAQRTALARTLVREPRLLLLDEPFSALDEVTRAQMQDLVLSIARAHQTAVVMVTHDIDEALRMANRIILLGGKPGEQIGEWCIELEHPRDDAIDALEATRLDILHTLRRARTQRPTHSTVSLTQ